MGVTSFTNYDGGTTSINYNPPSYNISERTLAITLPSINVMATDPYISYDAARYYSMGVGLYFGETYLGSINFSNSNVVANSGTWATCPSSGSLTIYASWLFSSDNPTTKTTAIATKFSNGQLIPTDPYSTGSKYIGPPYNVGAPNLGNINVTFNIPPTFGVSQISYDTSSYIYTNLTTASVTVDAASDDYGAKYGGYITKIRFEIGPNQYDELEFTQNNQPTSSETLSIPLTIGGTHQANVIVTDSREQTTTTSLGNVVVSEYNPPSVLLYAQRTLQNGTNDDQGTYATVRVNIQNYDNTLPNNRLLEPLISVIDEDGETVASTVMWYANRETTTSGTLSDPMTWTNVQPSTSSLLVYALISGLNPLKSYSIRVTARDVYDTDGGEAKIETVEPAFFTVDFLAGGHGIAFGTPAVHDGFVCDMNSYFYPLVGTVQMYAGQNAPDGWAICNGQEVSRSIYKKLFSVIGTTYGAGDGSTTFNLPDLRGRVVIGESQAHALASSGGEETHILDTTEMPSHTHTQNAHSHGTGNGSYPYYLVANANVAVNGTARNFPSSGGSYHLVYSSVSGAEIGEISATAGATATNQNTGGGGAHNNMQPYLTMNYIIHTGVPYIYDLQPAPPEIITG